MANLMDGISNVNSLTTQIEQLRAMQKDGTVDPKAIQYALGQNFNTMLDNLVSASEDDDDNGNFDPFSFMTDYNNAVQSSAGTDTGNTAGKETLVNPLNSLDSGITDVSKYQSDPQLLQSYMMRGMDF
ncbi:MAG: hypothetical protein JW782_06395 [Candidatus Saganbacteria bacterium]|nr:hypothetical protein [Candidatus Saganbacteria bacterium]